MTSQTPKKSPRLQPIGIYGGGQLGYMLAEAARRMGFKVVLYCQKTDESACSIADKVIYGAWNDRQALTRFAKTGIIGVACEFEQADPAGVRYLSESHQVPTHTLSHVLGIGRDRLFEKRVANEASIPTTPYIDFDVGRSTRLSTNNTISKDAPVIVKTRTLGYDGKGQIRLPNMAAVPGHNWKPGVKYIAEQEIDFDYECSVQVTRALDGRRGISQAVRNKHTNRYGGGMLEYTIWCKGIIPRNVELEAQKHAMNLAEKLELVGVMTVEFFVTQEGKVIFNEFAPRPHNSFHAREASIGNQFDLYIAALAGRPLVPIDLIQPFIMVNLIGDQIYLAQELEALGFRVTDYRKGESRSGRKMGHAVRTFTDKEHCRDLIPQLVEIGVLEELPTI
jgi:5-(carboxyamino)imidazole ribonucleotide synthase